MAKRIIFKESGLDNAPIPPVGYKYIGYLGSTFSERSTSTFSSVGGGSGDELNFGNYIFVSPSGDDSTAVKGNFNKPYQNLWSAKNAATASDIVYVLPGTYSYDNRNSASNQFNGQIETKVNLWKNGVTYYFAPGAKVVFYNQTVSGQIMYLFSPTTTYGETCKVLGYLEWTGNSTGADTSNGHSTFFWTDSSDNGFNFYAEFKSLTSYACEVIRLNRTSATASTATFIGDEIYRNYLGGQSGTAAVEAYQDNGSSLTLKSHVRSRTNLGNYWYFQFLGNFPSVNIYGDYLLSNTSFRVFWLRSLTGVVNIDIKKIYHGSGNVFETAVSGGWTLNLNADIHDYVLNNSSTGGVFWIATGGNTINFTGNVSISTGSGNGRYVAGGSSNNTYNIKGDINYVGTSSTTNVIFYPQNAGVVNYTGKITGNYAGGIAQTLNGTVNINNSYIKSTIEGSSARLFFNGTTGTGSFRLNNSYVELNNNTNALGDGSYINAFINNSTIINTGTASSIISNTTNFGRLQILNSSIIGTSSANTIFTSGTTSVLTSNVTINGTYSIVDLKGSINIIPELLY